MSGVTQAFVLHIPPLKVLGSVEHTLVCVASSLVLVLFGSAFPSPAFLFPSLLFSLSAACVPRGARDVSRK